MGCMKQEVWNTKAGYYYYLSCAIHSVAAVSFCNNCGGREFLFHGDAVDALLKTNI